jgi:hypothetical protein
MGPIHVKKSSAKVEAKPTKKSVKLDLSEDLPILRGPGKDLLERKGGWQFVSVGGGTRPNYDPLHFINHGERMSVRLRQKRYEEEDRRPGGAYGCVIRAIARWEDWLEQSQQPPKPKRVRSKVQKIKTVSSKAKKSKAGSSKVAKTNVSTPRKGRKGKQN